MTAPARAHGKEEKMTTELEFKPRILGFVCNW